MKYELQRLGATGFQDVVAALAVKALGAHVRPMGIGRDGGRDLLSEGVLLWTPDAHYDQGEKWDGTTVFQVKHKLNLEGTRKDPATLWQAIKAELEAWASPHSGRGNVPHYVVFATNIPLTPAPGSGGFDTINRNIADFIDSFDNAHAEDHLDEGPEKTRAREERLARRNRMRRLREWRLWDGYQLEALLHAHDGVRRAFDGFLTVGDVLADLSDLSPSLSEAEIGPALREHARWALLAERRVYFNDAGGEAKGVPVESVVIDLPVLIDDGRQTKRVVRYVLERGDHVLKPSATVLDKPRHMVVTGAPGNGKSTIAKFLTHAYRAAFVGEDDDLGDDFAKTVHDTRRAVARMGGAGPSNRRWPVNVDLAKLATAQGTDGEYRLVNWIAERLTRQAVSKNVSRAGLWKWLQVWPSFVVLDGLDEVTEPAVRQTLIASIEAFVADAEANDCDMLVLVTTRPTGYSDELPPSVFERINLADLDIEDALQYGRLVTGLRVPNDPVRRAGIVALLEEAAKQESLRHLLRTPLQTLIMSIIAEQSGRFSPSRFELFWGYYTTIEQREKNKTLGYSALLRDQAQLVLDLHLRVGLLLQSRAETTTGAEAILPVEDLREIAFNLLVDSRYEPLGKDKRLLDQILKAATQRLVLLTPQPGGGYGFDVRSLQELMAAYALTTGPLDEAMPRLRLIGASPHWRNTLLFAAGRYFAERQPHQKKAITELVMSLDDGASDRLSAIFPVGPNVALEIVDDGMTSEPTYLYRFVEHALTLLRVPDGIRPDTFARMLMAAAAKSEPVRTMIAGYVRDALGSDFATRRNVGDVQMAITTIGRVLNVAPEVLALASVKRDPAKTLVDEPRPDWDAFWGTLRDYSDSTNAALLEAIGKELVENRGAVSVLRHQSSLDLSAALADRDIAFIVEEALAHVARGCPVLIALMRHNVMPALWRRPVTIAAGAD